MAGEQVHSACKGSLENELIFPAAESLRHLQQHRAESGYWIHGKEPLKRTIWKEHILTNSTLTYVDQAAVSKYPRTGWLKHQMLISHSPGGWKSEIRGLVSGWFLGRTFWWQMAYFSFYPHMARGGQGSPWPLLLKALIPLKRVPPSPSDILPKGSAPNTIPLGIHFNIWMGTHSETLALTQENMQIERKMHGTIMLPFPDLK